MNICDENGDFFADIPDDRNSLTLFAVALTSSLESIQKDVSDILNENIIKTDDAWGVEGTNVADALNLISIKNFVEGIILREATNRALKIVEKSSSRLSAEEVLAEETAKVRLMFLTEVLRNISDDAEEDDEEEFVDDDVHNEKVRILNEIAKKNRGKKE